MGLLAEKHRILPRVFVSVVVGALLAFTTATGEERPAKIETARLGKEIVSRVSRVTEFREIGEIAKKMGLKVYLFGGTAASFANYVKWDLERESGLSKASADRFDYEYTHIFRHNQDVDLVVTRLDGTPESVEQIQALQKAVQERFQYAAGEKSDWEIRGLKTGTSSKESLLGNPDFLGQHSDSQSTGLIEVGDSKAQILDLRSNENGVPTFLRDVTDGTIHYYWSPTHASTQRAKAGNNPAILSAIRYLTKSLQFGLKMDPQSLARVKEVFKEFDPKKLPDGYPKYWIEKNGKKLFQNALDLEQAWNLLEDLGIRKKLIEIQGDPGKWGSLAWWMSREPLRSKPHPAAYRFPEARPGRTAKELGIEFVTHATKSFEVYESVTRSPSGKPNLLISRDNVPGESASEGVGLYSLPGKQPPEFIEGFSVRMAVDPSAREGVDFTVYGNVKNGGFVLWRSSEKLTVVPENLPAATSHLQILSYLVDPKNHAEKATKARLIRSSEKIPWTQSDTASAKALVQKLLSESAWQSLSELLAHPQLPDLIRAELLAKEFTVDSITKIRNLSLATDTKNMLPLSVLGSLLPIKTPEEFIGLWEHHGKQNLPSEIKLISFLKRFFDLAPDGKQISRFNQRSFIFLAGMIALETEIYSRVKSFEELLAKGKPKFSLAGHGLVHHVENLFSHLDRILALPHTEEQLQVFYQQHYIRPDKAVELRSVKSQADFFRVFDRVSTAEGMRQYLWPMFKEQFVSLGPLSGQLRDLIEQGSSAEKVFRYWFEEQQAPLKTGKEILDLVDSMNFGKESLFKDQAGEMISPRLGEIFSEAKSVEEMLGYLEAIYDPKNGVFLRAWLPAHRELPRFLGMDPSADQIWRYAKGLPKKPVNFLIQAHEAAARKSRSPLEMLGYLQSRHPQPDYNYEGSLIDLKGKLFQHYLALNPSSREILQYAYVFPDGDLLISAQSYAVDRAESTKDLFDSLLPLNHNVQLKGQRGDIYYDALQRLRDEKLFPRLKVVVKSPEEWKQALYFVKDPAAIAKIQAEIEKTLETPPIESLGSCVRSHLERSMLN